MKEHLKNILPAQSSLPRSVLLCATATVCAALPGANGSTPLAALALILEVAVLLSYTRTVPVILPTALFAGLVGLFTRNLYLTACVIATVTAIGIIAYLLTSAQKPWATAAIIPLAYLTAIIFGRSPIWALLSLAVFPAAGTLAFCIKRKKACAITVGAASTALTLTVSCALMLYVFISNGRFDISLLQTAADSVYDAILQAYIDQFNKMAAQYAELGYDISQLGVTIAELTESVTTLFCVLPALLIGVSNILSYSAHKASASLIAGDGRSKLLTREATCFSMSWVSAAVYVISYFVMFITSYSNSPTAAIVAENVYLIMLPGMTLVGFTVLIGRQKRQGKKHVLPIVALALLAFIFPSAAVALIAFIGCMSIIRDALSSRFGSKENDV